jgi:hypothetical protein
MIKTLARYSVDPENDYSDKYWAEFVFNEKDVLSYNRADTGYTTIETKEFRVTIAVLFENFEKVVIPDKTIVDAKAKYEYEEQ